VFLSLSWLRVKIPRFSLDKLRSEKLCLVPAHPAEGADPGYGETRPTKLPRRSLTPIEETVKEVADKFGKTEIEVLVSYLQHSKAGREILSQITDAYRQSLESRCFHNIGYLFEFCPSLFVEGFADQHSREEPSNH